MQHEITSRAPLLDAAGNLREAGYAKRLLPVYDRAAIRAGAARIKEWDYYLVANDHYAVALTIDDNGYMGLDSISFLHFDERWEKTKSPMRAFPTGRTGLPASSAAGDTVINRKHYALSFRHEEGARVLTFHMEDFLDGLPVSGRIRLTDEPEESMVICTPFEKPGHFYYNQKINCMRASGLGARQWAGVRFRPGGLLRRARLGARRLDVSQHLVLGQRLRAGGRYPVRLEHRLWLRQHLHCEREHAILRWPGAQAQSGAVPHPHAGRARDYLRPWTFTSDDGRFEMDFVPILDRAACTDVKLIKSDQHQVFGRFTGTAVLDDGTAVRVKDFLGFAEKVENKW